MATSDDRIKMAMETIEKLLPGDSPGRMRRANPPEIDRDYRRFTTAVAFGDVWSRPGLDLRSRSIATIAALTALHLPAELRTHVNAALNLGISRQEICEVIMQMALYAGMPASGDGLRIAAEVFAERDATE